MATKKHRLNISLPADIDKAVISLAQRDKVPQATKATHLLQLALELEEDQVWDSIARTRDTKQARFISHGKAWT